VASVYSVPFYLSPNAAYHNTLLAPLSGSSSGILLVMVQRALGQMIVLFDGVYTTLAFFTGFDHVLCIPAHGLFIRPFDVAGDLDKYL